MSNNGLVSVDITLYNILCIQVLGLASMSNDGLVSVDNSIQYIIYPGTRAGQYV